MKTKHFATTVMSRSVVSNTTEAGRKWFSGQSFPRLLAGGLALSALVAIAVNRANALCADEAKIIEALDTQYQAAVQKNDPVTMDRLLADDFVLVTGSGRAYSKADLLEEARSGRMLYERQEDGAKTVRVWGSTAVITAKLWAKGTENGRPFEYTLWFSDTYVRTPTGWRYVFGQSSLPLPKNP